MRLPKSTTHRSMWHTNNYTGELQSVDGYMNIALEQTKEYVDGRMRRNYGDAFVRGNNGMHHDLCFDSRLTFETSHVHFCGLMTLLSSALVP